MKPRPGYTVVIHKDGATESRRIRLGGTAARIVVAALIVFAVGLAVLAVSYGPVTAAAARVPLLEREVARLKADNRRVTELARMVDEAEARYAHLRGMLGADVNLPEVTGRAVQASDERLYVAPPILARSPLEPLAVEAGPSVPHRWPVSVPAYRTRGLAMNDPGQEAHAGLDLAVPLGSDVRASGGGRVRETGDDPAFGLYVLVSHPQGWETMYGHLSRVLVQRGDSVTAGQVIGLSGNTGRSTAPHLHFEVRRAGRSVDPLSVVREGA
jgi:murein DD-endopeptidase MepM/ murein hydrolase activator NlpD